ncbi:hypothetical protein RNJ44_00549 [Nakaseomyces bracarensis]|uniref:Uncharacterized protein n=1 Tax=Nakaseomyces bracarensis TaxID=273131 RepID=A0ABR4NT20_9SACH
MLSEKAEVWIESKFQSGIKEECLKSEVLQKVNEITKLVKDSVESKDLESNTKELPNYKLDWDIFYELSTSIMDKYTHDIDELLNELDKLCRKQYLWQDSAVVIDSYKGASMIGKIEKWIRMKESHLEYKQSELERSAQEIQNTLDRLTQERSEN